MPGEPQGARLSVCYVDATDVTIKSLSKASQYAGCSLVLAVLRLDLHIREPAAWRTHPQSRRSRSQHIQHAEGRPVRRPVRPVGARRQCARRDHGLAVDDGFGRLAGGDQDPLRLSHRGFRLYFRHRLSGHGRDCHVRAAGRHPEGRRTHHLQPGRLLHRPDLRRGRLRPGKRRHLPLRPVRQARPVRIAFPRPIPAPTTAAATVAMPATHSWAATAIRRPPISAPTTSPPSCTRWATPSASSMATMQASTARWRRSSTTANSR